MRDFPIDLKSDRALTRPAADRLKDVVGDSREAPAGFPQDG